MKKRIITVVSVIAGVVGILYLLMCIALTEVAKMEEYQEDYYC